MAHPHPQYGGSMYVPVLDALMRRLPAAGFAALRWNFRGVGGSEGSHGKGITEAADAVAAIDAASARWPSLPIVALGYSFGAGVMLRCGDARLDAWIAIAPQLESAMVAGLDVRPKLLLVPAHDQFCDPAVAREVTTGWTNTNLVPLPSADHFLAGSLDRIADLTIDFLAALTPTPTVE
jgi:uncharacterized protein